MKNGLYLFTQPSGGVTVIRIGWIKRLEGDEYEVLNSVTPKRAGDYETMWSDVAIDGPPKKWSFTRPIPGGCPITRWQILGPVPLQESQWTKLCPKPKDWE